jgi:hypothetical protein
MNIELFIKSLDKDIKKHEKSIFNILFLIFFLFIILFSYSYVFFYKVDTKINKVVEKFEKIEDFKDIVEEHERRINNILLPEFKNIAKELKSSTFFNDREKLINFLNSKESELNINIKYLKNLMVDNYSSGKIDMELLEQLKENLNITRKVLNDIKISDNNQIFNALLDLPYNAEFDNSNSFIHNISNDVDVKQLYEFLKSFQIDPFIIYSSSASFLLILSILISLYKFHYNQVAKYTTLKNQVLFSSCLLNTDGNKELIVSILSKTFEHENINKEETFSFYEKFINKLIKKEQE